MLLSSQNKSSPPLSCPAEVSIANAANSAIPQPRSSQPAACGSGMAPERLRLPGSPGTLRRDSPEGLCVPAGSLAGCPAVRLSVRLSLCPSVRPCLGGCPAAAPRFGVGSSSPPALPGRARWEQDKHNLVCEREGLSSRLPAFFFFFSPSPFFFFFFFPLFSPPRHEKPPVPEVPQTMEPMCWYRRS